jgi:adenylate cyclase
MTSPSTPADQRASLIRRATLGVGRGARSRPVAFYVGLAALFLAAIFANHLATWTPLGVKDTAIDMAVRLRLSSPAPDPGILIVDIDERSLAALAPTKGRWPWPRSVIAETLAGLSDAGAQSILVNLTFSDPDIAHKDDDAMLEDVLAHAPTVVLPLTRLNPVNDGVSQVSITRFAGAEIRDRAAAARPVAVIAPAFPAAYDRLGFNNLRVDSDGAVRRYDPYQVEAAFAFPSIALRALQVGGVRPRIAPDDFPQGMLLNWRNMRGDYARRSFVDVAADLESGDPARIAIYRGKRILIGASAVGIGSLKGTAAAPLTDDTTILATAMDDMAHRTYLKPIPSWVTTLLSMVSIIGIAASFIFRISNSWINALFASLQTGFIAVTIYCASYTSYLVDISATALFAVSYFAVAKVYAAVHLNALRGSPAFSDFVHEHSGAPFLLMGLRSRAGRAPFMVRRLERRFGVRHVLYVDNLFDSGHMLQQPTRGLSFVIIAPSAADQAAADADALKIAARSKIEARIADVAASSGAAGDPADDVQRLFKAILSVAAEMV